MFSLTIICTVAMLHAYYKHTRHSIINSGDSVASNRKKHGGVVKITSLITVLYVVFCGPFLGVALYELTKELERYRGDFDDTALANLTITRAGDELMNNHDVTGTMFLVFQYMLYMNGLVDVAVYCIFEKDFRRSLKNLITCTF